MKTCIYILLCCSFIFSESKLVQFKYFDNSMLSYKNNSGVDVLKSAIFPGWGQYSSRNYKKAAIFLCVESIAFGIYYHYNKKGVEKEKSTRTFGDQHWSFSTWVTDYYDFDHSGDLSDYRYIFTSEDSDSYKQIWSGGHKLEFTYNDEYYTTGSNFESFYNDHLCPQGPGVNCNLDKMDSIKVTKDHHYYENIGKYDHFFAGWDDNDEIEEHIKESGEIIAMSPNKRKYRSDWELSSEFNRFADYALYTIYTNHIVSLLDILVFSKINKNSKFNYKLRTTYNPNNSLGVGGIELLVSW